MEMTCNDNIMSFTYSLTAWDTLKYSGFQITQVVLCVINNFEYKDIIKVELCSTIHQIRWRILLILVSENCDFCNIIISRFH